MKKYGKTIRCICYNMRRNVEQVEGKANKKQIEENFDEMNTG